MVARFCLWQCYGGQDKGQSIGYALVLTRRLGAGPAEQLGPHPLPSPSHIRRLAGIPDRFRGWCTPLVSALSPQFSASLAPTVLYLRSIPMVPDPRQLSALKFFKKKN